MRDNADDKHLLDGLHHIEGFPIGEDEDLQALSDPPYYTAYPNPHIAEFIEKWGQPYDEATDDYHREPFVSDVSEGKAGHIYSAHTYHTKVPYKAIIPFIKHYTGPGDTVLDGFCGSGMTGIAAQMAGRRAILSDLSPVATFIAYNYNTPIDDTDFVLEARRILKEVTSACGWMYETWHPHCDAPDRAKGRINYTVWSDLFECPYCSAEVVFWEAAFDEDTGRTSRTFACPDCSAEVNKRILDPILLPNGMTKQVPVLINYSVRGQRYDKKLDWHDFEVLQKVDASEIPYWYPQDRMMHLSGESEVWGDNWRPGRNFQFIPDLYTKRALWAMACLWDRARAVREPRLAHHLMFWIQSISWSFTRLNRYLRNAYSQVNRVLSGTLYLGSMHSEISPWYALAGKIKRLKSVVSAVEGTACISTNSATAAILPENSVDYVFTDPPFGDNLSYAELNFLWESWLQVFTNTTPEAIISETQSKDLTAYRQLMTDSFKEMYRVLRPGRWITVVFHNSKASVWNAIQEALARAGFLVAQVTVMDKQQGTFKQVTSAGAVKNDLIINAYKPRAGFTQRFLSQAGQKLEADFVRQHLAQLPVAANVERSKEMLYSKYLAYYVQHGYQVVYNAEQFYRTLPQWGFKELDGYWFADEAQANEYETRKAKRSRPRGKAARKQSVLFISDERSARQWLWNLMERPMTYDEIYTAFVKALQTPEDQLPEPMTMLEEGFVRTDGQWKRPDALTQAELEARRQARLLRQFEEYLKTGRAGQRLKEVRKEALVVGFTEAYRAGRFQDILTVGRRLPKRLLESSPDLFDFIDIAEAKVEG